jgi:hypothetical protein
MEPLSSTKTLVTHYQTTRCHNPEDHNLNLKYLFLASEVSRFLPDHTRHHVPKDWNLHSHRHENQISSLKEFIVRIKHIWWMVTEGTNVPSWNLNSLLKNQEVRGCDNVLPGQGCCAPEGQWEMSVEQWWHDDWQGKTEHTCSCATSSTTKLTWSLWIQVSEVCNDRGWTWWSLSVKSAPREGGNIHMVTRKLSTSNRQP